MRRARFPELWRNEGYSEKLAKLTIFFIILYVQIVTLIAVKHLLKYQIITHSTYIYMVFILQSSRELQTGSSLQFAIRLFILTDWREKIGVIFVLGVIDKGC